jgi:predicted lipid-binding transport protein (Tim44 family)
MFRPRIVLAAGLAIGLALAPGLAFARAGGGASMGSRGGFTFSAPPSTSTAPMGAAPMQRSMTAPSPSPSYGSPSYGSPGYAPAYGGRSPFASGLMGGLIGAGIGGLLFGHGMFGGMDGGMSFIGLLIQLALLFFIGRWLFRMFTRGQPMFAGMPGAMRQGPPPGAAMAPGGGSGLGGRAGPPPLAISPADYTAFENLLGAVQAAWSAQDLAGLRQVATPEMVSYFNEQLSELASRGVRNTVTDVRLEKGDLSQAWSEGSREYATVAMRFSMIDVTRDAQGRVVDGSPNERLLVTELWTFLRNPGGRWILSAIQQTR